jgi:hypothetical protein
MRHFAAIALSCLLAATPAAAQRGGASVPGGFIPMDLYCPADAQLGALPNSATVGSYRLPEGVAREAAWILVHVQMYSGNVRPNGPRTYRIVSERRPYRPFSYLFYHWGYPGSAVNSTSQDYWLPAPGSGQIQIAMEGGSPYAEGSRGSEVRLIGYVRRGGTRDCASMG